MSRRKYSLLYPAEQEEYKTLSQTTMHDLGLDQICKKLSAKEAEQNYILNVMARMYRTLRVLRPPGNTLITATCFLERVIRLSRWMTLN